MITHEKIILCEPKLYVRLSCFFFLKKKKNSPDLRLKCALSLSIIRSLLYCINWGVIFCSMMDEERWIESMYCNTLQKMVSEGSLSGRPEGLVIGFYPLIWFSFFLCNIFFFFFELAYLNRRLSRVDFKLTRLKRSEVEVMVLSTLKQIGSRLVIRLSLS